jgi:hypothetical protein
MICKKCGCEDNPGCSFEIRERRDMEFLNISQPGTFWLCYTGCYPPSWKECNNE